ncbi:MAG: hypothetical protein HY812_06520 [Planctomycetes bacterium]|nr:hypothetical protein [Planctomycetota bacterium]
MVHEFANLLTVLDGLRQIDALGAPHRPNSELIEQPLARCHGLLEAFRGLFSERGRAEAVLPAALELADLRALLVARLRGRPTRVSVEAGPSLVLSAEAGTAARLAFLCAILGVLEHGRGAARYPEAIELSAHGRQDRCTRLLARFSDAAEAPADHPAAELAGTLTRVAGDLLRQSAGRLAIRSGAAASALLVEVLLPE